VGLDALQIERDVERLYTAAGADFRMPASLLATLRTLARLRHDGLRAVRMTPANDDGDPAGRLRRERVGDRWEYEIELVSASSRSDPATSWLLGHEAGEWRVHHLDAAPPDSPLCEALANNWAGALLVPASAFRIAWDCWDDNDPVDALKAIAEQFGTTIRVAGLRLGEVLDYGVAVINPYAEPLFGRPIVQRRGWLARAPISDAELVRLAWRPDDARRRGWFVRRLERKHRLLIRERPPNWLLEEFW
jgi:hypothetical protein